MNLNLLPAFLKSALHFITGLQLRIIVKPTITWTSWMGEVTNLASSGGGWFAEQLSTHFRALL